jgi:molybdopterin-guanine dinucleotide biosynthesis protein MobB
MTNSWPPIIGVSGKSGSGKTLLIEQIVPRLIRRGARVTVIKHCTHRIEADTPGKDSDRIFSAGANILAAGPGEAFARFHVSDMPLRQAARCVASGCDICLVEGYRGHDIPRIQVISSDGDSPDADPENTLLAVADVLAQIELAENAVWQYMESAYRALPVIGLILIGGQSRRMGRPKSLLEDASGPLLERIVSTVKPCVQQVLLAGNAPAPAALSGMECLLDAPSVEGPLAGILGALRWNPAARWLVLACDLPRIQPHAVEWLLSQGRIGADAVLPRLGEDASVEPLFALYEPTCLPRLEQAALERKWALHQIFAEGPVSQPVVPAPLRDSWTNVNTLAEWEATRRTAKP